MNKRTWALLAVIATVLILFVPIPKGSFDDGGTREYEALTYKIVRWHRLIGYDVYESTRIYFGKDKALSIDELWKRECAGIPVIDDPPVVSTTDFTARYIRTDGYREDAIYPLVTVIRSTADLQAYYEANKHLYDLERRDSPAADSSIGFLDACDVYDDTFFASRCLVLVLLEEGSGSVRHDVTAVRQNANGELTIDITTIVPEIGTCDMAQWHLFVETDAVIADERDVSLSFSTSTEKEDSL